MNSFVLQMRNLGPGRLAAMAGVAVGMLAFIIYFAARFSSQPMELLFGDLATADSKGLLTELDTRKIPYELRNGGTEIWVPGDQVLKLRVQLAEQAMPNGASMGYEVFDNMDNLSATNFIQQVNLVRALEGELARTIRSIDGVKAVRVHLVMPKREVFSREMQEPSAAVYIKMGRGRLDGKQVLAIQHLVAGSVPKLEVSRISIVDEHGSLLASGGEDAASAALMTQEEFRRKEETRLARSIEELLERSLGPGKVRAEVRADIDFDKVITNQEIFDPDSKVTRSTVNREENNQSRENQPDSVSVQQNLPDANVNNQNGAQASNQESRTEETVNYEISKKIVNQIKEGPQVARLSVAVLVDGTYTLDGEGKKVYAARPDAEVEKLTNLVRTAVGFNADRGDRVEVVNMPFTGFDDLLSEAEPWQFLGFSKDEIMRMAEGLGVALVAVLVILLVVRPLVTRAFEGAAAGAEARLLAADGMGGAPQLMGPGGAVVPAPIPEEEDISDELIDIDKVEGRVKASSLRKIGEIVDKHPEEALSIIRNWLYQEA